MLEIRQLAECVMQSLCQPSTKITCPSHAVGHQTSHNVVLSCRHHVREVHQDETSQVELFLNSVPILASLTREEKMMLVDALEEQAYAPASRVINQVTLAPCTLCIPTCFTPRLWPVLSMPMACV